MKIEIENSKAYWSKHPSLDNWVLEKPYFILGKYWGVDIKQNPNIGENHLGRLIMKIRGESE